ncbi:FAD-binding protein [Roseovarius sp. M141]|uniref:FAD-binding protein n=1 Tax=Roseovarius sp. M141 TaxID=2583806 RepID=UPI0020CE379D|nr:FAD-binding protein [Roseovarius sp. M141]MCQ0091783.1 FAD-binding protein [Roseovarius sp. M141]
MRPETEQELAQMVAGAAGPLRIVGGGTRSYGLAQGEVLSTAGLSGVTLYEPGALTLVARAGTPLAEVEALLAREGQCLPFEPMDHRVLLGGEGMPTIGGVVAGNVSGPRRISVGACRDFLLGVRFVDGMGRVLKNGGRVMKNVTGYDLARLMAGSHGTLGVLSEVSLKVLPVARASATLALDGLEPARAVAALSRALGSPYEVSGATHVVAGAARTLLRLEGFAASVAYRAERLSSLLAEFGDWQVLADAGDVWRDVRDVAALQGAGDVWRLSTRPSDAPALAACVPGADAVFDWGGGLIWLRVPEGTDLRAELCRFDGHATLVRASPETKLRLGVFPRSAAPLAAIEAGLRARFDPRGIFTPGLMAPGGRGI